MRHSSPLLQGALDGLCGPYSIVNALTYLAGLSEDDQGDLFKALIRSGGEESRRSETEIAVSRPFSHKAFNCDFPAFFAELAALVDHPHRAAIIGLSKPYEHWTDATHLSGSRIVLRDSIGLHFIDRANCGLHGADKPFAVDHRQTFAIERIGK